MFSPQSPNAALTEWSRPFGFFIGKVSALLWIVSSARGTPPPQPKDNWSNCCYIYIHVYILFHYIRYFIRSRIISYRRRATNLIINICRCGLAFVSGQRRDSAGKKERKKKVCFALSYTCQIITYDLGMLLFDVFYEQLTRLHVF
jgi:hypothetical protein